MPFTLEMAMHSLILIPGLLCDHRLWSAQIEGLRDCAEVAVADIAQQMTIAEMATEVLAKSPERFSMAGFSLGSQVALEIVSMAGERVDRLALLSATRGGLLPATATTIRRAIAKIETGGFEEYLDEAFPTYFAPFGVALDRYRHIFFEMARTVGEQAGLRQMRALLAIAGPFTELKRIQCPTLVVGGREDRRTTPEAHRQLSSAIPGSELLLIEGAAHFTPLEKPTEVTLALRRWLSAPA
jgi:pimeloyl-ACP methyl ester carboxylesterase